MSIVRKRDVWQAKRHISELELMLADLDKQINESPSECKYERWAVVFNDLVFHKAFVAEHEPQAEPKAWQRERPPTESTLMQFEPMLHGEVHIIE